MPIHPELLSLIKKEKWEYDSDKNLIVAYDREYPVTHPAIIHLNRYRKETIPQIKFNHMKAAHDYLWPQDVSSWHYWTEDRFFTHCSDWNVISWAGCASSAKSYDVAKILIEWWLANPQHRAAMVASTTLTAMGRRVWGYTTKLLNKLAVKMPYNYTAGNSPQILYPYKRGVGESKDTLHGIFAAAAKQGTDETAISGFIGTHPDEAMMLILDECTDLPIALLNSLANLKSTEKPFQLIAIGNSSQQYDLHGALSTPKDGWESVNPYDHTQWETTQNKGICLYFNAYNSPAIHEQDPEKKKILEGFLATSKSVAAAEDTYGKDSMNFWRFTLGYWMPSNTKPTVMSKNFMEQCAVYETAHWLGEQPLQVVAGLDFAISTGGDSCLIEFAYLGQTLDGSVVLDFKGGKLRHKIDILPNGIDWALQVVQQAAKWLRHYGCSLKDLSIDATGQGRALSAGLILEMKENPAPPIKIYTTRTGGEAKENSDVTIKTRHELYFDFRRYVETGSIKGIDSVSAKQFTDRLIHKNDKTNKQELETKKEYKARLMATDPSIAHSPDEADVKTLCLQTAIINYGFTPGQRRDLPEYSAEHLQEIKSWKAQTFAVIEENRASTLPPGFPSADFSSGEIKKWGSL